MQLANTKVKYKIQNEIQESIVLTSSEIVSIQPQKIQLHYAGYQ